MVHEDFYPVTEDKALITTGHTYTKLTEIRKAKYKIENGKVVIIETEPYIKGTHLRLGNIYNDRLYYSDNGIIKTKGREIDEDKEIEGEQPFTSHLGLFYTSKGGICLDDNKIISLWDDYKELGNPFLDGKWLYFEARIKPAPQGWQILRYNMETREITLVKEHGANPCIYKGKLFYSVWGENGFETRVVKI